MIICVPSKAVEDIKYFRKVVRLKGGRIEPIPTVLCGILTAYSHSSEVMWAACGPSSGSAIIFETTFGHSLFDLRRRTV